MKVGDKVTTTQYPNREFDLVWYQEGDSTCAVQDEKIRAIVKDSSYYKFISIKADGFIYHTETTTLLGRTQPDVVEYLKNPLNEEILVNLTKKVEQYWNQ